MNGIEAVEEIMERTPTPVLMLSAHTEEGAEATFEALDRGAIDVLTRPAVVMAHAFVAGGLTSGSERDISAGGVGRRVSPEVFDGVDLVALGHLHGAAGRSARPVRYSGSPVAMSFSEAHHGTRARGSSTSARRGPPSRGSRPRSRDRWRSSAVTVKTLLSDPRHVDAGRWCQVTLTDPVRPAGAMDRLRRRFPHTLRSSSTRRGFPPRCGRTPSGPPGSGTTSTSAATSSPTYAAGGCPPPGERSCSSPPSTAPGWTGRQAPARGSPTRRPATGAGTEGAA